MNHGARGRHRPQALLLALIVGLVSSEVRADGLADEAELHFQRGASSYQKGDFSSAIEHFLASNRLVPNQRVVFNIARTYEQLKAWPEAYRYYVDVIGRATGAELEAANAAMQRLAPNVAVLEVTTEPVGATIFIDRKDLGSRGKAPRPLALTEGRYRVIAELPGYEPRSTDAVEVKQGATVRVTLKLERIVGRVKIALNGAAHARVRVDDEAGPVACNAPCELPLPEGAHDLFFAAEGAFAPPRKLIVEGRRTTEVTVAMRPLSGIVVVSTPEAGALVAIDGRTAGFTPAVVRDVPAGRRRLRLAMRGYAPIEREIEVRPTEQLDLGVQELVPQREVTAVSRHAEELDDAPSSVSIIDRREIEAFGYPTIAEALRGQRGISLTNDRAYTSIAVRGVGQPNDYGNRLLVLADGQPLNDNLLNSSYIGSDGRGDLHDVERIEVVRGPGSLLYGAGALAGVVNLVTRSREEPSGVHVGVGTYDDAVARGRGGFHLHFGRDSGVWASAWGAHSNGFAGVVPETGKAPQSVSGLEQFTGGGTAGRAYWGPATVQWFVHERSQSIPVGVAHTIVGDPRTVFDDRRMMAEARVEPKLGDSVQLLLRAHANQYAFNGTYAVNGTTRFPNAIENLERYEGTWLGGEARIVYSPSARLRATLGGEAQWHPTATLDGHSLLDGGTSAAPYLDARRPYQVGAAYALAEGSPVSWMRLSGGMRLDAFSTVGVIVVPRGAIIVKPRPGGTLKIMGGRAFRLPSMYEQHYNDGGESQKQAGKLSPESIVSGEVEYTQRFREDWVVLGAAHGSFIENLIASVPDSSAKNAPAQYRNQNNALVVGGDGELRREWRRGLMLAATYSYQNARYVSGANSGSRVLNVPDHLAGFRTVIPVVPELLSAALRMALEAPRRLQGGGATSTDVVADVVFSGEVRAYGVRYALGLYNVADRRYEVPVSLTFASRTMPQNGRTLLLDLIYSYP